jgi:anaerobic ribonucleoside-triphosphate reductase activating protein
MKIALNRLHYPVSTLGVWRRVGVWLQGCSIGCPGCMSRDTWVAQPHHLVDVGAVVQAIAGIAGSGPLDGITISGGEPFEQPQPLLALLRTLRAWLHDHHPDADVLCYSGLPWARLQRDHAEALALLDVVVPEPYVRTRPQVYVWRGSANQPLHCLTELARRRYARFVDLPVQDASVPRVQLAVDDQGAWMIGLPDAAALQAIEAAMADVGLSSATPSWR